ncbi:hypothetical protein AVEN_141854-1 [Araneus ventricosus]|uniref:Uncharacterized protein n=1 Tax=Araneus ventricosus TaxID=182803 RepID=A0A4Y2L2C8_ARAVE|nr:hypothetical protein AVEN_141854-1 [Araneus ventricosus]
MVFIKSDKRKIFARKTTDAPHRSSITISKCHQIDSLKCRDYPRKKEQKKPKSRNKFSLREVSAALLFFTRWMQKNSRERVQRTDPEASLSNGWKKRDFSFFRRLRRVDGEILFCFACLREA